MAIYMKYGDIKGGVTTEAFKGQIEVRSFQLGVGRSIGTAARGTANREHSEPSISEIHVTKDMDVASDKLFEDAIAGVLDNDVEFSFTTTSKSKVETYLKITLKKAGLSGYSVSSGGDTPTESLSINFAHIEYQHAEMGASISPKTSRVTYDLEKMKANA